MSSCYVEGERTTRASPGCREMLPRLIALLKESEQTDYVIRSKNCYQSESTVEDPIIARNKCYQSYNSCFDAKLSQQGYHEIIYS